MPLPKAVRHDRVLLRNFCTNLLQFHILLVVSRLYFSNKLLEFSAAVFDE